MIQIYILYCCFTIIMPIFDIGTNHWLFPMGIKTFRRSIKSSFRVLSVTVTLLFGQALHASTAMRSKSLFSPGLPAVPKFPSSTHFRQSVRAARSAVSTSTSR